MLEIAFSLDAAMLGVLPTTLRSVTENTDSPVRVTLLTRGIAHSSVAAISRDAPEVTVAWFAADALRYPPVRMLPHCTISTMDRIWLPSIMQWTARTIYLDVDVAAQADLRPLFDRDLRGCPLAGRPSLHPDWRTGAAIAGRHLPHLSRATRGVFREEFGDPKLLDFDCFNCGVLVLDLAALRQSDFTARTLQLVADYMFHDQYAIGFFCRGHFDPLEPTWNHFVGQEAFSSPAIIHYAGARKPWADASCPHRESWLRYRRS